MTQATDGWDRRKFLSAAGAIAGTGVAAWGTSDARAVRPASNRNGAWVPSDELMTQLPMLMKLASLPGMSLAVIEDGEVVWRHSLGVLNADTGEPAVDSTLFEAASMSKPVFAYAVLQLADQGKLELERPLVSYFKPAYIPDDPNIARITARHVLTHTSGLPNWGVDDRPDTFRPKFPPGRYFSYSGEGIFWLQLVIEHLTGKGLDAFMREQLFEPAGMRSSTYVGDEEHVAAAAYGHVQGRVAADQGWRSVLKITSGYAKQWGKPLRDWRQEDWVRVGAEQSPNKPPPPRVRFENAAASLLCTPADYGRFVTLLCARPNRASWEISEATRRAMVSPQVAVQDGLPLWWGLGVSIERSSDGGWRIGHEGNNDGRFTSYSGANPDRRRGLVVMTNGGSGFGVYQRVVRSATGLDQLSFIADEDPPRPA